MLTWNNFEPLAEAQRTKHLQRNTIKIKHTKGKRKWQK